MADKENKADLIGGVNVASRGAEEEARLSDDKHLAQLADALVRGIEGYFSRNPPLARSRAA